jgi:hypothetical protein
MSIALAFPMARMSRWVPVTSHRARRGSGAPRWRTSASWNDAEFDLRLSELGVLSGDENVTHHGELASATQRVSIDSADQRLVQLCDEVPISEHVRANGLAVGLSGHLCGPPPLPSADPLAASAQRVINLLDVSPAREELVVPGDDHGTHSSVTI